ncbi:MAG TPA: helix-hairpin-helix domain-containing protein, partial [Ignavibacteria bacterium]|nr:helix-hairpin-helix domain-containing protein [Ignavibacteria bacterium]
ELEFLQTHYELELLDAENYVGEIKNILKKLGVIEKEITKEKPFEKVLYAIGIRHIGERSSKLIALHFGSMQALTEAGEEDIDNIHDIGPAIAKSVHDFVRDKKSIELIHRLENAGLKFAIEKNENAAVNENIKGKIFVLTGTLEKYTRDRAKDLIESMGGRVTSSVSKKTDYVLAGYEAGSKLEKAKSLKVKILSEKEFEDLINS